MQVIPLQAVANQTLQVTLGTQNVQLNIYQKFFGLFVDVLLNNVPVIQGVIAKNLNLIVRSSYLGFTGDLCFQDTEGSNDPDYTGLGSRYQLLYLAPADLVGQSIE